MIKYSIIVANDTSGAAFDVAFDVVQNSTHPNKGSVGELSGATLNEIGIGSQTAVLIRRQEDLTNQGFNASYVVLIDGIPSYQELESLYNRALVGEFDNLDNNGELGGEPHLFTGDGEGGLGLGGIFNIKLPPFVWLMLATYGTYKSFNSNLKLPWYALTAYSGLKYVDSKSLIRIANTQRFIQSKN